MYLIWILESSVLALYVVVVGRLVWTGGLVSPLTGLKSLLIKILF